MASGKLTPLLKQYLEIKEKYKQCLIFFRLGDFYELFFEDAELSSQVLGITLTKRGQLNGKDIPMCGVPYHQGENYLARLLKAGFKVAICEQTETPEESKKRGYKAIIERKVVRIATPGTLTEEIELGDNDNNYLMVLISINNQFCASWVDISTGEICIKICESLNKLLEVFHKVAPSELLISDKLFHKEYLEKISKETLITEFNSKNKDFLDCKNTILKFYHDNSEFNNKNFSNIEIHSLSIILDYISYTQNGKIPFLNVPVQIKDMKFLEIDNATKRNLEIIKTLNGDNEGSLLHSVNYTLTPLGKRKLSNDIESPLSSLEEINKRLNLVEFFLHNYSYINVEIKEKLKKIPDITRSTNRLTVRRGSPRDLQSILQGIEQIIDLVNVIDKKSKNIKHIDTFHNLVKVIKEDNSLKKMIVVLKKALKENIPIKLKEGNFIKEGYDLELDTIRKTRDDSKSVILDIEKKEKQLTGINGLKIKYNNFLGYFIDLSAVNNKMLIKDNSRYIHRQTLKNSFRYTTSELIEISEKILNSDSDFILRESKIYNQLINIIELNSELIYKFSDVVARIDVAQSWADYSKKYSAVRPSLLENSDFTVIDGRHPSVEKSHSEKFISNSCILKEDENNLFKLITGPNMSGKSTYLRQNAIILIMAQAGGFCPAKEVVIGICDKLFCRVGSGDELAKGNSTFMVEMLETANILNSATKKSLVILDEIGRGTSTFDGISIAWATSEYLLSKIKCKVLFATHYNELSNLVQKFKGIDLNTFRVKEWKGDLIFLYEIIEGLAESSYGIQVGKMAGLPKKVTDMALSILSKLEKKEYDFLDSSTQLKLSFEKNKDTHSHIAKSLFQDIRSIDINQISPMQALQKLEELQKKIDDN
ncbi:MAG: DNA mismatch repair protein MutS [Pseudomonadota bacterium]|nr:DNA mismatch repair protein MutS [Pseudomonadota bacterium]